MKPRSARAQGLTKAEQGEAMRTRILDVAERRFADFGYDGISLRKIASEASIDLALLIYYFKTKEGLYRSVFARRIEAYTELRHVLYADLLNSDRLTIRQILTAYVEPWFDLYFGEAGRHYAILVSREMLDPREQDRGLVEQFLDPISHDILGLVQRVVPDHAMADAHWIYHAMTGANLYVITASERIKRLSKGICDPDDRGKVLETIVSIFEAAFAVANLTKSRNGPECLDVT